MMKSMILLALGLLSLPLSAQRMRQIPQADTRLFELVAAQDTIAFLKLDSRLSEVRPVMIVLQGSLPIPLGIEYGQGVYFTSFPFDRSEALKRYHLINLSMPHVPVLAQQQDLAPDGSLKEVPAAYQRANYLAHYVRRTQAVIEFLREQPWGDPNQLLVFGHSQGAYVALKVACTHPAVTQVIGLQPLWTV